MIEAEHISKSFVRQNGTREKVLDDVSLAVYKGEIVTILGKSGCGKSTLLNILGGFDQADKGEVRLDGRLVVRPDRRCVMLFQNYGLLPWRSVLKNVEFGLESIQLSKLKRKEQALNYLRIVGLQDNTDLLPHQLSGGMQQRVAIARALAAQPDVVLMDEPFAALDTFNRYDMQDELLRIQEQEQTTIVLVTHDIDEAVYVSDRILIMSSNPGRIHQQMKLHTAKPRDRSQDDFQHFRKQILELFYLTHEEQLEDFYI